MKKLLACLLVPLTALALGACKPASTSPESKPAELNWQQPKLTSNVWKISKEGQPDSYLLGTIHMGQTNQTLSSDALKLLQSADQLTTEVDALPDSSPETKKMYQKYFKEVMSTEPLSRKLGKTDFRLLQEISIHKMKKADPSPKLLTNSTRGQHWFLPAAHFPKDIAQKPVQICC